MAERVTVATLTIDEQGAVRSVNNLVGAEKQLDRQTSSTASAFTARMFSMRTAAVAFLGGFTLAGAIYQLKQLGIEALKTNESFSALATSWERVNRSAVLTIGNLPGVSSGLEGVSGWLDRIDRVLVKFRAAEDAVKGSEGGKMGVIGRLLFGATAIGQFVGALDTAGKLIDKVLPPGQGQTPDAPWSDPKAISEWEANMAAADKINEFYATHGGTSYTAPKILPPVDPGAIEQWEQALEIRDRYLESLERQVDILQQMRDFADEGFGGPLTETEFDLADAFSPETIDFAAEAWDGFASAIQYAAVSLANFIAEGGKASQLFSGMLKSLAVAMFVKSAEYVAYAIAASTGIGAVTLQGSPAQFLKAAAKFAGVGAAAALGARAAGGGGGGLAVGGYGGVAQGVGDAGAPAPQVTIILQGEHSDVSIRKITGGVLKSIGDGVGVGQWSVVPV